MSREDQELAIEIAVDNVPFFITNSSGVEIVTAFGSNASDFYKDFFPLAKVQFFWGSSRFVMGTQLVNSMATRGGFTMRKILDWIKKYSPENVANMRKVTSELFDMEKNGAIKSFNIGLRTELVEKLEMIGLVSEWESEAATQMLNQTFDINYYTLFSDVEGLFEAIGLATPIVRAYNVVFRTLDYFRLDEILQNPTSIIDIGKEILEEAAGHKRSTVRYIVHLVSRMPLSEKVYKSMIKLIKKQIECQAPKSNKVEQVKHPLPRNIPDKAVTTIIDTCILTLEDWRNKGQSHLRGPHDITDFMFMPGLPSILAENYNVLNTQENFYRELSSKPEIMNAQTDLHNKGIAILSHLHKGVNTPSLEKLIEILRGISKSKREEVRKIREQEDANKNANESKRIITEKEKDVNHSPKRQKNVVEEQKKEVKKETKECVICFDADWDTVFADCGHLCCCNKCAAAVTSCPICKAVIIKRIRVYTS